MHKQPCCLDEVVNHPLPIATAFWIIWSFHRGMMKLNAIFDADLLLYRLSHFECDRRTVHILTQWCLPPPLTSTVKTSLFTRAHSSPLSLAARWHQCCTNCSHYISNGWTFSWQTLYSDQTLQNKEFMLSSRVDLSFGTNLFNT